VKKLSQNQIVGQRGEHLVASRTLAMGFAFDVSGRLETGIDGILELRDPQTGKMLARMIGVQVKTTEGARYAHEDDHGFEYLLNLDDLSYWRGSNIPVIIILVRLSDSSMYWKEVDAGTTGEPRRLRFNKATDCFDKSASDRVASLTIARNRLGIFVPPTQVGDPTHLTMVRVVLPGQVFVGSSLFASGRDAARELAAADPDAPFDWVIRDRRFISFRDPGDTALTEIVDVGSIEGVETETLAFPDDTDDEYVFIDLLARTLRVQLEKDLSYDRDNRALYFRALAVNKPRKYRYQSLVNETSADVVLPWRGKTGEVRSVRHHAFVPRFQRLVDEWYLNVAPTFVFTRDGFQPHYHAAALIAGKKKKERNGAVRGQFVMLMQSGTPVIDLLATGGERPPVLRFQPLTPILMPSAVPEDVWRVEDPNAQDMIETERLF
jgi:hypothetical protein